MAASESDRAFCAQGLTEHPESFVEQQALDAIYGVVETASQDQKLLRMVLPD
jgi:hypothetical protein